MHRYFFVSVISIVCRRTSAGSVTVLKNNETIATLPSLSSAFGPSLYEEKVFGHILFTSPLNACSPVNSPPLINATFSFIGLVRRHDCSFVEKVLNVQHSGFKAILIFDPDYNDLITMSGSSGSISIYSFFIGESSKRILSNYLGTEFVILLEDQYSGSFGFLLIPLIIGVLICLIFVIIFMILRHITGFVAQWRQQLSRSVLKLLPLRKFRKEDSYDMCAVCLEDFKVNEKLRILPCSHAYHQSCIDPWLTENKRTCPLCNKPIITSGQVNIESQHQLPNEFTPLIGNQAVPLVVGGSLDNIPSMSFGRSHVLCDGSPNVDST